MEHREGYGVEETAAPECEDVDCCDSARTFHHIAKGKQSVIAFGENGNIALRAWQEDYPVENQNGI